MAGSLKWFEYTTDAGVEFAMFMDESNGEAVSNADYTEASTAVFKVPGNVIKRHARYASLDNRYARTIPCSTPTVLANAPELLTIASGGAVNIELRLRRRVGEVIANIPAAEDTGIDDGDPS